MSQRLNNNRAETAWIALIQTRTHSGTTAIGINANRIRWKTCLHGGRSHESELDRMRANITCICIHSHLVDASEQMCQRGKYNVQMESIETASQTKARRKHSSEYKTHKFYCDHVPFNDPCVMCMWLCVLCCAVRECTNCIGIDSKRHSALEFNVCSKRGRRSSTHTASWNSVHIWHGCGNVCLCECVWMLNFWPNSRCHHQRSNVPMPSRPLQKAAYKLWATRQPRVYVCAAKVNCTRSTLNTNRIRRICLPAANAPFVACSWHLFAMLQTK